MGEDGLELQKGEIGKIEDGGEESTLINSMSLETVEDMYIFELLLYISDVLT